MKRYDGAADALVALAREGIREPGWLHENATTGIVKTGM